jgi:hypothetical protein
VKHKIRDDLKGIVMEEDELAAAMKAANENPTPKKPRGRARARSRSRFIMFPEEWRYQLARVDANKCTYRLALYLLWEVWRSQSNRVKLANVGLKELGVGRWGKRHALDQLAKTGLISTERQPRKSPIVMVRFTD